MNKPDYKGHKNLACMIIGHINSWRASLEMCASFDEDPSYYDHEMKALAEVEAAAKAELEMEK